MLFFPGLPTMMLFTASEVLTLSPSRVKVAGSVTSLQPAPLPSAVVGRVYLPLLFAPMISTLVMVLFQERLEPTLKRTAVRAWRKARLVVGATFGVTYSTSPEQAVMRSF